MNLKSYIALTLTLSSFALFDEVKKTLASGYVQTVVDSLSQSELFKQHYIVEKHRFKILQR